MKLAFLALLKVCLLYGMSEFVSLLSSYHQVPFGCNMTISPSSVTAFSLAFKFREKKRTTKMKNDLMMAPIVFITKTMS